MCEKRLISRSYAQVTSPCWCRIHVSLHSSESRTPRRFLTIAAHAKYVTFAVSKLSKVVQGKSWKAETSMLYKPSHERPLEVSSCLIATEQLSTEFLNSGEDNGINRNAVSRPIHGLTVKTRYSVLERPVSSIDGNAPTFYSIRHQYTA